MYYSSKKSNFYVDAVTSDGAQWNRGVWTKFGIKDGHFHCKHSCGPSEKLWFFSDFPHLIKCFRNGIFCNSKINQNDGFWVIY